MSSLEERVERAIEINGVAVVVRDSKGRLRVAAGRCVECGVETSRRETPRCREHAALERRGPKCTVCGKRGHTAVVCPQAIGELAKLDKNARWRARHGAEWNATRRKRRRKNNSK